MACCGRSSIGVRKPAVAGAPTTHSTPKIPPVTIEKIKPPRCINNDAPLRETENEKFPPNHAISVKVHAKKPQFKDVIIAKQDSAADQASITSPVGLPVTPRTEPTAAPSTNDIPLSREHDALSSSGDREQSHEEVDSQSILAVSPATQTHAHTYERCAEEEQGCQSEVLITSIFEAATEFDEEFATGKVFWDDDHSTCEGSEYTIDSRAPGGDDCTKTPSTTKTMRNSDSSEDSSVKLQIHGGDSASESLEPSPLPKIDIPEDISIIQDQRSVSFKLADYNCITSMCMNAFDRMKGGNETYF